MVKKGKPSTSRFKTFLLHSFNVCTVVASDSFKSVEGSPYRKRVGMIAKNLTNECPFPHRQISFTLFYTIVFVYSKKLWRDSCRFIYSWFSFDAVMAMLLVHQQKYFLFRVFTWHKVPIGSKPNSFCFKPPGKRKRKGLPFYLWAPGFITNSMATDLLSFSE